MAAYESLQGILEEAGLQHTQLMETPYGSVDGVNKIFVTHHKPLADANYSDSITPADVIVYVDNAPVRVMAVEPQSGTITLQVPPTEGSEVKIDYRYSSLSLDTVDMVREEAQELIDDEMYGIDPVPYSPVPKKIRLICRVFAAGLLLSREYGYNTDSDGHTKDGEARIKRAEKWLDKYKSNGGNSRNSSESGIEDFEVQSTGDIFASSLPEDNSASDNDFIRNLD